MILSPTPFCIIYVFYPMNRKILWTSLILFLLLPAALFSSEITLESFNLNRIAINKLGMYILGGWAVLNLGAGTVGAALSEGRTRYFFIMNASWNVVNLGIAAFSLYSNLTADIAGFTLAQSWAEYSSTREILLLNAGLDVAYMMSGLFLRELSRRGNRADLWKGFGDALLIQGGFLFVFDVVLYLVHGQNGVALAF